MTPSCVILLFDCGAAVYGVHASPSARGKLEAEQQKCARIVTGCIRLTRKDALLAEADLVPLSLRAKQLAAEETQRLIRLPDGDPTKAILTKTPPPDSAIEHTKPGGERATRLGRTVARHRSHRTKTWSWLSSRACVGQHTGWPRGPGSRLLPLSPWRSTAADPRGRPTLAASTLWSTCPPPREDPTRRKSGGRRPNGPSPSSRRRTGPLV